MRYRRRKFLHQIAAVGASVLFIPNGITACTNKKKDYQTELEIGTTTEFDKITYKTNEFNNVPILTLKNEEGKYETFSLECTHQGCIVKFFEDSKEFRCPCHKGVYNTKGEVIKGPPPAPLRKYTTIVKNGKIIVLEQGV
ncbi:MAG: ubiquinol-cytochrome c reductase iron-sulfur subunit [Bacteroidia bacterium]|nr:ubiquinol-cytochrome c reductase iron-sulfur subunit [Bacteroidia bacterium]